MCVAKTSSPTASPTRRPSKAPTPPTSQSPTVSPTASVVLFSDNAPRSTLLGSRAVTTATCQGMPLYASLGCSKTAALLCYSGDTAANLPSSLDFAAGTPVRAPTGTHIAENWPAFIDGPLESLLETAVVNTSFFYTGCSGTGALGANCAAWTSNSAGSTYNEGWSAVTSSGWLSAGTTPFCNAATQLPLVCVCVM